MSAQAEHDLAALPPQNVEAEQAVIGSVLLAPSSLDYVVVERGLRTEHFYRREHQMLWSVMVEMADRNEQIDVLTVCDRLDAGGLLEKVGGRAAVDALTACAPAAGNVAEYARIVAELARHRERVSVGRELIAAGMARDDERALRAEASIGAADAVGDDVVNAERGGDIIFESLNRRGPLPGLIKLPWSRLNRAFAGGFRPGNLTFLGAWGHRGKSCVGDAIVEFNARAGARCAVYLNEMSVEERLLRFTAALAPPPGVSFTKLVEASAGVYQLTPSEQQAALHAAEAFTKTGITIIRCYGWQAQEIDRHIRRARWDACVIDLLGRIPSPPGMQNRTTAVDEISRRLNDCAGLANTHMILVGQLRRERAGERVPPPAPSDIRESSSIYNDASNVVFLHRDQFEVETERGPTGIFEDDMTGTIYTAKQRNAPGGSVSVEFDARRMRFVEATA